MAGNNHGGPRPGSGRPKNAELHAAKLSTFTDKVAAHLPQVYKNLEILADGGFKRVEYKYEPASQLTRRDVAREPDGTVIRDARGKPTVVEVPLYPGSLADKWVRVSRKVTYAEPNFKANELMADRIGGTPRPSPEVESEILEIRAALDAAVAAIAARKARPPASDEPPIIIPAATADDDETE
jgi:hypothetical protein